MHIRHHQQQKNLIEQALVNYVFLKESAITHVSEKDKFDLEYLTQSCLDVFFCKAYLRQDNDNLELRDFIDTLTANLVFSINAGKEIKYTFRGKTITITPDDRDYGVSTHLWNMAFFGAELLQDEGLLKVLTAINLNELLAASGKKKNYTFNMAEALQAFFLKQKNYPELLSQALQENMNVDKKNLLYDKALDIDGPTLELLYLILMERNDQFNDKLLQALEWHKKYHLRLEKKGLNDNTGLVSLPLTAMVMLAKKLKNFTIAHTSDYVPDYLLKT